MSPPRLTRARALDAFARSRVRGGRSPHTIALELRLLRAALARLGRRSLARVTARDLEAYLALRAREVRATTRARELTTLRAFFAWLTREGMLARDPALRLSARPGAPRPPLLLSRECVQALFAAALVELPSRRSPAVRRAIALRNRALLELLYGLGLRASEASAARVCDLDLSSGCLLVRRAKRGEPRQLPLPPRAFPLLERYLRDGRPHLRGRGAAGGGAPLLLTERGTPLVANEVLRVVKHVAQRAGLRAHPHALRRALATHLVQDGVSLACVKQLLGHVRLDTTQRYVLVERDDLRRAVEHLDRGPLEEPGADSG